MMARFITTRGRLRTALLAMALIVPVALAQSPDSASGPTVTSSGRGGGFLRSLKAQLGRRHQRGSVKAPNPDSPTPHQPFATSLANKKPTDFSFEEERQWGESHAAAHIEARGGTLLSINDHRNVWEYVYAVVGALARRCSRPEIPRWTVVIIANHQPYVLSAAGGYLIVTTGALTQMASEAELAGALAREMAHVCRRNHLNESWGQSKRMNLASWMSQVTSQPALAAAMCNQSARRTGRQGTRFPKRSELEADVLAVDWMYRVGYSPRGLATYIRRTGHTAPAQAAPPQKRVKLLRAYINEHLPGWKRLPLVKERYHTMVLTPLASNR